MLKIGKRLRELRMEKGYSQEYLAHEINMTQGNYSSLKVMPTFLQLIRSKKLQACMVWLHMNYLPLTIPHKSNTTTKALMQ